MLKIYCPHCGIGNEYSVTKPKNCNKCGKSLSFASAPPPSVSSPQYYKEPERETFVLPPPDPEEMGMFGLDSVSDAAQGITIRNFLGNSPAPNAQKQKQIRRKRK